MSSDLAVQSQAVAQAAPGFTSIESWQLANRIGQAFAASTLVPQQYRDNVANCIVALEMANRMGASPLMVMQNLYIVHGNPGWSAKFLIACFNQCGRFSALRYDWTPNRDGCRAWAIEKATGDRIDGPQVTVEMAQKEGWSTKQGSKWKTMPELMLMYRAAAFLIRTYAPEISMGLSTDDELHDVVDASTGEITTTARKPSVAMPVELPSTPVPEDDGQVIDAAAPADAQSQPNPENAAEASTGAAPASQPREPNGTPATDGERKLVLNRVRNNNLDLRALLEQTGLADLPDDLAGLTKDGFIALKDLLPKAA